MKRTALKRRTPLRARRREKSPRVLRLGVPVPAGPGWKELVRLVCARDQLRCRYCGSGAVYDVDHILPRRLLPPPGGNALENLALLCDPHHARKTSRVEARLFQGHWYELARWITILRLTGPVPSPDMVGRALKRLNDLLQEAHDGTGIHRE